MERDQQRKVRLWTRWKQSWRETSNWNKLMVLITAVIAVANSFYTHYAHKQFRAMDGQLKQMESSSKQTDQLIHLYQQQLTELHKQATDTHALAEAAGKQADAAKIANTTTREALTSVQRAFVSFVGTMSVEKAISDNKITALILTLPWGNTGTTPTKNAVSRVNWEALPGDMPGGFAFTDQEKVESLQFDISPRGFGNGTVAIPIRFIDAARKGNVRLFVWGWITYHDIFEKTPTRLSEFCDEITDIKSSTNDIEDSSSTISWKLKLCRVHNCSDERCSDYKQRTRAK